MRRDGISIEVTINGYIRLSTMWMGQYVTRLYIDYSKREAIAMFKETLKELSHEN